MRNNKFFGKGERSKAIMDILRESGKYLTSDDIAAQVVKEAEESLKTQSRHGLRR